MWKAAQRKEKLQRTIEKPKLDNARKLRGICFNDPEDVEFKDTMKNARKSWNCLWSQPCFVRFKTTTAGNLAAKNPTLEDLSVHASLKLMNPRESVCKELCQKNQEDCIAVKELKSSSHHSLVLKFIFMLQAMKILDAIAAVDQEMEKLEKLPAWQMAKLRSKTEVVKEAQKEERTVHCATLMDIWHLTNSEL